MLTNVPKPATIFTPHCPLTSFSSEFTHIWNRLLWWGVNKGQAGSRQHVRHDGDAFLQQSWLRSKLQQMCLCLLETASNRLTMLFFQSLFTDRHNPSHTRHCVKSLSWLMVYACVYYCSKWVSYQKCFCGFCMCIGTETRCRGQQCNYIIIWCPCVPCAVWCTYNHNVLSFIVLILTLPCSQMSPIMLCFFIFALHRRLCILVV